MEKPGDGEDGFAGPGAVVFCLNDAEGVFFVGFWGWWIRWSHVAKGEIGAEDEGGREAEGWG